ncbi:unannotated protein [freshwater metagenome]|uniref:Unannotated protein n=1 Tax=freshwater metagenome TaxID=449393 RepID=A0A6J6ZXS9_9ZZZZ
MHLDGVAAHTEVAAAQRHVVAVVLEVHQAPEDGALVVVHPHVQLQQLPAVLRRVAHAIDARHRGHDNGVPPREQSGRCRVSQPVDLVVDRRVLLDIRVARRDVRLGLVVVVVGDEVLHPVVREELAHLLCELRGERLVGRQHKRWPLDLLDGPRDRCALAGPSDPEQRLEPVPALDADGKLFDCLGLIPRRLELGDDLEPLHGLHAISERPFVRVGQRTTTERRTSPFSILWNAASTSSSLIVSDTKRSRSRRPWR